ncbi:MAG: TadE family protein [Eggerthellaceae bacterium]
MRRTCESGRATVEAAFLLPVLFVGLLLLMQPGILLYDRLVMQAAASEGCRLLATKTAAAGDMPRVARRSSATAWERSLPSPASTCTRRVQLRYPVRRRRALRRRARHHRERGSSAALLDAGGALLGIVNGNGNLEVQVTAEPADAAVVGALVRCGRRPGGMDRGVGVMMFIVHDRRGHDDGGRGAVAAGDACARVLGGRRTGWARPRRRCRTWPMRRLWPRRTRWASS